MSNTDNGESGFALSGKLAKKYRVMDRKHIGEYAAECVRLRHVKTGMEVFRIIAEDEEMFFSFSFPTPPENDKGTAHIIEHSVLSGSKSFDVSDPFETCSSLSALSYINAETHPNWTTYPVASAVKKDFISAFRMYADAVFNPLLKKVTFLKEGIRGIFEQNGDLVGFTGVVCNEMREGESTRSKRMIDGIRRMAAKGPDRFDSGGSVLCVPFLSYDEFISYYKRYYTPKNCVLTLYGGSDCDEILDTLDAEFLSKPVASDYFLCGDSSGLKKAVPEYSQFVDKHGDISMMKFRKLKSGGFLEVPFSKLDADKPSFAMVFDTGVYMSDPIEYRMLSVLVQALLGSFQSPLYNSLVKLNIAKDIGDDTGIDSFDGKLYFVISFDDVLVEGSSGKIVTECEDRIRKALASFKFDRKMRKNIDNALKTMKVEVSDKKPMRGRAIAERIMTSPFKNFSLCEPYACLCEIEKQLEADDLIFKRMFDRIFLSSSSAYHKVFLVPSDKFDKKLSKIRKELVSFFNENSDKKALSDDAEMFYNSTKSIQGDDKKAEGLFSFETLDNIVGMMKFPKVASLALDSSSDVSEGALECGKTLDDYSENHDGIVMHVQESGLLLSYFTIAFRLNDISEYEAWHLQVLIDAMRRASVAGMKDFSERFFNLFHSFSAFVSSYPSVSIPEIESPCLVFRFKILNEDIDEGMDLLAAFLKEAVFTERNVIETINGLQAEYSDISYFAPDFSRMMSLSDFSSAEMFRNVTGGILFKGYIDSIDVKDKVGIEDVLQTIRSAYGKIFARRNLILTLLSDHLPSAAISKLASKLDGGQFDGLDSSNGTGKIISAKRMQDLAKINPSMQFGKYGGGDFTFYQIPSDVSYPSVTMRCPKQSAALEVVSTRLQDVELYREVRVSGGAYGAYINYDYYNGTLTISSIRDPNGIESFKSYFEVLKSKFSSSFLDSAKRSFLVPLSHPQSNERKSYTYFVRFVRGITDEMRKDRVSKVEKTAAVECKEALDDLFRNHALIDGDKSYAIIGGKHSLSTFSSLIKNMTDDIKRRAAVRRTESKANAFKKLSDKKSVSKGKSAKTPKAPKDSKGE